MFFVTKTFEICYAHRLMDYDGPCKELHGHNGIVEVAYQSETLGRPGMVFDFGWIKDWFKPVKESLDHTTILQRTDPLAKLLLGQTNMCLLERPPTAEALAEYIGNRMKDCVRVKFWETRDNMGEWQSCQ